jgi:hypothetical protein
MGFDRRRFATSNPASMPGLIIKKERERPCIPLPFSLRLDSNQAFPELYQQKKPFRLAGKLCHASDASTLRQCTTADILASRLLRLDNFIDTVGGGP